MTRNEYFARWRELLVTLDDHTLGVYLLHHSGRMSGLHTVPPAPSVYDLHARLFPVFTDGQGDEHVGSKPSVRTMVHLAEYAERNAAPKAGSAKAAYDATVLALAQNGRDLLTGDPTVHWNVEAQRCRELEASWKATDDQARYHEQQATAQRARANEVRTRLDMCVARMNELTAAAASKLDATPGV